MPEIAVPGWGPHVAEGRSCTSDTFANKVRALRPLMRHRRTGLVDHLISEIATSHEFAPEILSKKSVYLTSKVLTVFPFETNPKLPLG